MQIVSVLENLNISPNLQSLKFMRGFAAAKSFLLKLQSAKDQQIDKKPQNSLAFSPIAETSSIISEQNTGRDIGRTHEVQVIPENFSMQKSERKQITTQSLKNQVNILAKQLNQQHSQLVYTQNAIEVVVEQLRCHSAQFKRLQEHKHQQRQKNIRLLALKSSVDKKKTLLKEAVQKRQKFKQLFKFAIKEYFIDQYQNFSIEPILQFSKQIIIKESYQLEEEETESYPQKLQLKYKTTKKKQKEKKKEEVITQPNILPKQQLIPKGLIGKFNQMTIDSDTYYDCEYND